MLFFHLFIFLIALNIVVGHKNGFRIIDSDIRKVTRDVCVCVFVSVCVLV